MIAHEVAKNAAVGRRPSQCGEGLVGIGRSQRPPDRLVLFDVVLSAQQGDGVVGDQPDFNEVVEEAVDDADLVQQSRESPTLFHVLQPSLQHWSIYCCMPQSGFLKAAEETAIGGSACRPELRYFQEGVDDGVFGIVPGAHDSTSDPGTSSATARRSSVASLR